MKKFFFDCGTRDTTASIGFLALRVMVGFMMLIGHGLPKVDKFSAIKDFFPKLNFYPFNGMEASYSLMVCIAAEAIAATMIIFGFATRTAAFVLGLCMVFIAFGFLGSAPWFQTTPTLVETKEPYLLYLIPMIVIILSGAGKYSFDAILGKDKRRRW